MAGELRGRTGAFLTVSDAASRVEVVFASLPGQLYRISTPADSGLAPSVSGRPGRVRAGLRPAPGDGPDEVRIVLNRTVRWDIRLPAGAGEQQLNLTGGRISRVDLGAAGLAELRLPTPTGTVPISFSHGVGSVVLVTPQDIPVRIQLDGGAGPVDTPWAVQPGAAPGTVLAAPAWRTTADRYAVHARSALESLTLHRSSRPATGADREPIRPGGDRPAPAGVHDLAPTRPAAR